MKKRLFYLIIFIIIFIVFFFWRIIIVSPQYSLKQIKMAISKQELIVFNKFVDVDQVIDSIITQVWQYYSSLEKTESNWDEIRNEISNSILSIVKPNLKEKLKKEVYNYVITGQWEELNSENKNKLSSLAISIILDRIDPTHWEYQSINYVDVKGDIAFLGLTYYDQSKKASFLVDITMRNMQGYWQLMKITNINQLLNIFINIDD